MAKLLDDIELLSDFDYKDVEVLAKYFQEYEVENRTILFQEGDAGDALYIVLEGKVQVSKRTDTLNQAVSVEGRGRIIGEMSLIDGEPRSATCQMLSKGCMAVITQTSFERLGEEHPALALRFLKKVMRLLSRRLRMTTGKLAQHLH